MKARLLMLLSVVLMLCASAFSVWMADTHIPPDYRKPDGYMAEAQGGDHWKVVGGVPGDQNGSELIVTEYQFSEKPSYHFWKFVIRCTDPVIADRAAGFVRNVCNNENIGYNNYVNNREGIDQRNTLYRESSRVGFDATKLINSFDTSCTPLSLSGFCAQGIDMSYLLRAEYTCKKTGTYTGIYTCRSVNAESLQTAIELVNEKYAQKGLKRPFRIIELTPEQFQQPEKYLKRGDVLCTGHHSVVVL